MARIQQTSRHCRMPNRAESRSTATSIAVYLIYLGVAVLVTWPTALTFTTRFAGHPFHDAYEYARHIWWIRHALETGQPILHQPLLAYPNGLNGVLLWSYPLQSFPAWLFAFAVPLPAAFNLTLLLRLAFDGWAAYWLGRYLTGASGPALFTGLAFMTFPTLQGHTGASHIGLLALWPVPLYTYALFRLRDTGQWRWVVWAAAFLVLSTWGSTQLVVFTILPISAVFAVGLIARRDRRTLRRLIAAMALGGLLALIWAVPLLVETLNQPAQTRLETSIVNYSADLLSVAAPSFYHPLYRGITFSRHVIGEEPFELAAYIGIVGGLLALVGVWTTRAARWWALLALVAWVLSLGPLLKVRTEPVTVNVDGYATYVTLPWAAFYNLPLINITRAPARFNFTLGLAVAALAGYGAASLWRRLARWRGGSMVMMVVLAALVVDYQLFWPLPTVPGVVPEPIAALAERDDIEAVFDIPWAHPVAAKEGMWLQTGHQRPLIAGHMARVTPVDPAKLTVLEQTLNLALLDAAGVDVIILHREWDDEEGVTEARLRERLGEPFYEDERFAAFDVPPPDREAGFVAVTAPTGMEATRVESYIYLPGTWFVVQRGTLTSDSSEVVFSADGIEVARANSGGPIGDYAFAAGSRLEEGYHTLAITARPACEQNAEITLTCRGMRLHELVIQLEQAGG